PWLLRFFDQIRFYEVSGEELEQIRRKFPLGQYPISIEHTEFSLSDYQDFIENNRDQISAVARARQDSFNQELTRWHSDGQFNYQPPEDPEQDTEVDIPEGAIRVDSSVSGSVWQTQVDVGQQVEAGATLLILESMKMEISITAPCAGR